MVPAFERLGALDRFFLSCESDATPMHIGAVCLFEDKQGPGQRVTLDRLRSHVAAKLDGIPRYRQRVAQVPVEGHPVWVDADPFRIVDHVRAVALPSPRTAASLEETVSWIFSRPLSRMRPLWEMWLIEGLAGGGFGLACKTHHCLADGLGGVSLLHAIFGLEPFTDADVALPWQPRPTPSGIELLRAAAGSRVRGAWSLATAASRNALTAPGSIINGALGVASTLRTFAEAAWQPPIATPFDTPTATSRDFLWWTTSLDDVKRIGHRLGGTVNDVSLALVCEAFAQVCPPPPRGRALRVLCPVGSDSGISATTLGNRVSGMLVDLPTGEPEPRRRWNGVLAATRRCKKSGQAEGSFLLADIADAVAPALLSDLDSLLGGQRAFNLVVTNVPGPQVPLYLFERKMTRVCPLTPLFRGQALGIAIFSYDGKLTWGLHVDGASTDAARELRDALTASLVQLARLADVPISSAASGKRPVLLRAGRDNHRLQTTAASARSSREPLGSPVPKVASM